jgi:pimeloyl-ACP methyl ester carboxylesterase
MAETRFVDVKGVRTRYFLAGKGEPLILVHGGHFGRKSSAQDWDLNIDPLAERFCVYALDKIGQGHSDNPASDSEYVIGRTVSHLRDFVAALGIGPAHFAGHSRGGYTVTRLAIESPELVKSLTIVSSASLMIPPNPIYREWDRCAKAIENRRDRLRYLVVANSWGQAHITESFLDGLEEMDSHPKCRVAQAKMDAGLFAKFAADLVERQREVHEAVRGGAIKAPTLVAWGYNDPSARFDPIGVDALRLLLPSVPQCEVHVLNQAGHYVYREQPDGFNAALAGFVARHAAA